MSGSFMGYDSEEAFRNAVGREMDEMATHSHVEGRRPGQERSAPQRTRSARGPDRQGPFIGPQRADALKGKPGSPERVRQVRAYAPQLWDEAQREGRAQQMAMLLDQWAQAGSSDYDAQVIYELAKGVHEIGDADMLHAVHGAVDEVAGEEGAEFYLRLLGTAQANEMAREQQHYEQAEQQRVENVQQQLTDEYRTIEDKLGPASLQAADDIAQAVNEAGLLYDPEVDPEQVRVSLRAAAETARGQEYTGNVFAIAQAIGEEMKRSYGPAGNDEDREKWEARMDAADIEIAERADQWTHPDAAAARAIHDRTLEKAGSSPLEQALDQEIENMSQHSSDAPHREALRQANAAEWERTHDVAGRETTDLAAEYRR